MNTALSATRSVENWRGILAMRFRQADRAKWSLALLIVVSTIWGLTDVRARGRVDPLWPTIHRTDVTVYTGAGAAMFTGANPYTVASPRGWHYLYPPLFAILISPLAVLAPQWQSVALFGINVLAGWGCYAECRRLWAWLRMSAAKDRADHDELPGWIFWLAGATVLLPALNCLQRGQLGVLMLYPLLLGFRWAVSSRTWMGVIAGGIAMAFPVTVKLIPALPVAFVCCEFVVAASLNANNASMRRRAIAASAGVWMGLLIFLIALPSLIVGPQKNFEYLRTWIERVAANNNVGAINDFNAHAKRNQSLTNAVYRLGNWLAYEMEGASSDELLDDVSEQNRPTLMDHTVVTVAMLIVRGALLALMLVAAWRTLRSGDRWSIALAPAMACLATLLLSPLSWGHYYVIWLPAAALVPAWLWLQGRTHFASTMAVSAFTLVWAHYVLMPWTGRIGLLGIGTTAWFVAACVAMVPVARNGKPDEWQPLGFQM